MLEHEMFEKEQDDSSFGWLEAVPSNPPERRFDRLLSVLDIHEDNVEQKMARLRVLGILPIQEKTSKG